MTVPIVAIVVTVGQLSIAPTLSGKTLCIPCAPCDRVAYCLNLHVSMRQCRLLSNLSCVGNHSNIKIVVHVIVSADQSAELSIGTTSNAAEYSEMS